MSDVPEIAQMVGAVGGLTGLGSIIYSLFARTKDLETRIADCHADRAQQAERIGKLEGWREATEALGQRIDKATQSIERVAESLAPPTHERMELDARTQELVDKHRKTHPSQRPLPKRIAPLPPKLPTFPKGSK